MSDRSGRLCFGTFELDLSSNELRKAGSPVKIQSQPLKLLRLLAQRRGEVVTRDEIRRVLWDDQTFVDFDRSITFGINQIRLVLKDDPRSPRFVETLPRKGYRFIAPVSDSESSETENADVPQIAEPVSSSKLARYRRLFLVLGALAAMIALWGSNVAGLRDRVMRSTSAPIRSLAVLPLENLSRAPDQQYFADGMTDELITALAKFSALRVVSRTSVMRYQGTKKPLPEIARELNVDAVVEGTVLRDQNRVRITAQLIRAAPEEHLWAESYEGNLGEVLTMQNNVASAIARSIQIKATPQERTLLATPRSVDPAAYEAYLKGRFLWDRPSEENLKKSQQYFEKAIERDSGYALAWAGLADTYNYLASWGMLTNQDARPRARAAAEKALEVDKSLVGPLVALAEVKVQYDWDWAGAEQLYKQAIELNPNYGMAHHGYATYLAEVGRMTEALAEARRAHEVEPLSPHYAANVIWKLYLARQYDQAELESRRLGEWFPNFNGTYALASVYLQTGRKREAISELEKDVKESHRGIIELTYLAHALGVAGDRTEGQKIVDEMLSLSQRRYVPSQYIAIAYEGLGERDLALQRFEKAVQERFMNGWLLPDQRLDQIRTEPRFKELMRQMGLPQ